jgi:pyruvate dehydrogenase E2 component (dihydrolipoamide acetyltransferase)
VIAEIETDKATMEVEAVDEGVLAKILVPGGTQGVAVGTVIAVLAEEGEDVSDIQVPVADAQKEAADAAQTPKAQVAQGGGAPAGSGAQGTGPRIPASPLARRIAGQKGLDIAQIAGTGPHGRVVKRDVEGAVAAPFAAAEVQHGTTTHPAYPHAPDYRAAPDGV